MSTPFALRSLCNGWAKRCKPRTDIRAKPPAKGQQLVDLPHPKMMLA
jgi:hypothetical protein